MPATWTATRELALDELEHFPGNARRGNVPEIRKSILANGQYRSAVVRLTDDGRHVLLAGNHTYDAMCDLAARPPTLDALLQPIPEDERDNYRDSAKALLDQVGRKVLRCEIVQCTDREARKINLADNRINELATDDPDALAELLSYLDGDYEGTGWTDDAVHKLIDPPDDVPPDEGPTRWEVVVECTSEEDQEKVYQQLTGEGRTCRVLSL